MVASRLRPWKSCGSEITRLELVLSQAHNERAAGGKPALSSAERLHRQPTARSVEQAKSEAERTVETALALARKFKYAPQCSRKLSHLLARVTADAVEVTRGKSTGYPQP